MKIFRKIFFLLNVQERWRAGFLFILIFIMSLIDIVGIASILPFLTVLADPNIVETNIFLKTIFQKSNFLGVESKQEFLFLLGIISFIILITSLTFKSLVTYAQVSFIQMRQYTIGKRLIEGYLHQPYSWFLSQHSADLGKNILSEVNLIVSNGINPFIELIAKSLIVIILVILLFIVDPILTLIVFSSIGLGYIFIFYLIRKYLQRIGSKRLFHNKLLFKSVSDSFGAIKAIKLGGLEKKFIKNFSSAAKVVASYQATSRILGLLPRYILEAVSFGGILLIILYIKSKTGNFNSAIPLISLYAIAGYRLFPALQSIYLSLSQLSYVSPSIEKLSEDLNNLNPIQLDENKNKLNLNNSIKLNKISYKYPNSSRSILKNITLNIPAKSMIGLVGATGSGKTTIVDIIMGLLNVQQGTLEVDSNVITNKNLRSWQKSIGYVPQNIYLSDDSISANIALGTEPQNIDQEAVEKAAKIANLNDFILNELPSKYETLIGENGTKLSGGQRQRIGIARALYHNPKVLVLDEATSALDNQTEKAVMDAVSNLDKDITIILIAHRLGTVKKCDKIFFLENGELKAEGNFDDLIKINKNFSSMAKMS